jgi:DNA-directed RNA polymerase subunit RPC12/RpoP
MDEFIGPTADTIKLPRYKFLFGRIYCSKCKNRMKLITGWKDYFKCDKCGHITFFELRRIK